MNALQSLHRRYSVNEKTPTGQNDTLTKTAVEHITYREQNSSSVNSQKSPDFEVSKQCEDKIQKKLFMKNFINERVNFL